MRRIETTVANTADDPEATLEKKNQSDLVRHALTKLSAEHPEVIDLVYILARCGNGSTP
jgi:hypothetical protein